MTVKRFFGGLLLVIGFLGMIFTGGCALTFLGEPGALEIVLLFSGVPFAICLGLFLLGRFLYKERPSEVTDEDEET